MGIITSKELSERTGATYRQIDYWCRNFILNPVGDHRPGSGYHRSFDEDVIPRVELLVRFSASMKQVTVLTLKHMYENFEDGFIEVAEGVILKWATETEKPDTSSIRSNLMSYACPHSFQCVLPRFHLSHCRDLDGEKIK